MSPEKQSADLTLLDELLAEVGRQDSPESSLLREHLEGARFYLTGAMPEELELNLKLAEKSLDGLADQSLQSRIRDFIRAQRASRG